jgi:CRISPR type IV-associated protein Csf2
MIERKRRKMALLTQTVTSYHFSGVATALSAISHLGDSAGGTTSIFRRERMLVNGRVQDIPILSGNAWRGQLRDHGMRFMLRELGEPTLSPAAFDFLTSGGSLTKEAGRGVDIGYARRLRELIPLVGVFGGACGRQMLPGKLQVGKWYPICKELTRFLPDEYQDQAEARLSIFEMTDLHSFTRMDDKKNDHWQKYLPEPERALLELPATRKTKAGEEIAEKPGVAQQMRYSQEVLIAGTRFYCWLNLNDVTPLEFDAFASAMIEWSKTPFVGGQSRHGCGLVELHFDNWMSVSPLAKFEDAQAVGLPVGAAYVEHLHSQRDAILSTLKEIG